MKRLLLVMLLLLFLPAVVFAQDPTGIPLSPGQENLLAQIDAADVDQGNWQHYKTLSFNRLLYSEVLSLDFSNSITSQHEINSTITTQYQGNPRNPVYNSDSLMTIEHRQITALSSGEQTVENYILTVNARYYNSRLYVLALRDGGTANLPPMPDLAWQDVTEDPATFPALHDAALWRYLPDGSPPANAHRLLDTDWVTLTRGAALREMVADIELVADNEVLIDGPNAGRTVRQIRVQLNPQVVLSQALDNEALVAALVNEGVDMSLTVWLDAATSRRLREQYIFVMQGQPDPATFGFDLQPETFNVLLQFESEISYFDVDVPIEIPAPEGP